MKLIYINLKQTETMKKEIKKVVIQQAKANFGSVASYIKSFGKSPENGDTFVIGIIEKCIKYLNPLGLFLGKKELIFTHIKRGEEWFKLVLPYKFYEVKHIKDDTYRCSVYYDDDTIETFTLRGHYEIKQVF